MGSYSMFGWIKKAPKGSIELAVERLESYIVQEGQLRRTAVLIWAVWSSSRIGNPTFRDAFFYGRCSMPEAFMVLRTIEPRRDQMIKAAHQLKRVRKALDMPAEELGSYATIKATALDLMCATIGVIMRPDLEERVRSVWQALTSSTPPDDVFNDIVQWFRAEAALFNELGGDDPAVNMEPHSVAPFGLPTIASAQL